MKLKSGKHAGQEYAYVLLRHTDDAAYLMAKYPDEKPAKEYKRLVSALDAKPFTRCCFGCENVATRASAYAQTTSLYFWCDHCDPYSQGANAGKLTMVTTFAQALRLAGPIRSEQKSVIKTLAEAKGCPKRLSQSAAASFLP